MLRLRRHLQSVRMTGHELHRETLTSLRGLKLLKHLSLNSCALHELCHNVGQLLPMLKTLALECNALTQLPESVCCMSKLTRLHLRDNHLEHLPTRLGELAGLEVLLVDSNELRELPKSLCRAASLRVLSLSRNRLRVLGEAGPDPASDAAASAVIRWDWCGMVALERLSLNNNNLTEFGRMNKS